MQMIVFTSIEYTNAHEYSLEIVIYMHNICYISGIWVIFVKKKKYL